MATCFRSLAEPTESRTAPGAAVSVAAAAGAGFAEAAPAKMISYLLGFVIR